MDMHVRNWENLPTEEQEALVAMALAVQDFADSPKWWVSWVSPMEFELETPWWISGYALTFDDDIPVFCAAVAAPNEEAAKEAIIAAHRLSTSQDELPEALLSWRFCSERPKEWAPFCDRFPRADWMKWL